MSEAIFLTRGEHDLIFDSFWTSFLITQPAGVVKNDVEYWE